LVQTQTPGPENEAQKQRLRQVHGQGHSSHGSQPTQDLRARRDEPDYGAHITHAQERGRDETAKESPQLKSRRGRRGDQVAQPDPSKENLKAEPQAPPPHDHLAKCCLRHSLLSDITARGYNYRYEYKKMKLKNGLKFSNDNPVNVYMRFKDEAILEMFHFENIAERHYSNDFNYLIGEIKLQNLLDLKALIDREEIFIAEF